MIEWHRFESTRRTDDNMFLTLSLWMIIAVLRVQLTSAIMGPSQYDWDPIENHTNYHLLFWGRDCGERLVDLVPKDEPINYSFGANDVAPGQYPFVVLLKPLRFGCAGSILNKWWILSSPRCYRATMAYFQYMNADENSGYVPGPHAYTRGIAESITHDQYDDYGYSLLNNIMLLRVDKEIEFTTYIQPICMVPPGYRHCLDESKDVEAVGWGAPGRGPRTLKDAKSLLMHTLPPGVCKIAFAFEQRTFIPKYQLCTEYTYIHGVKGALCHGDTGAPLFKITGLGSYTRRAYQLGVFSVGSSCDTPDLTEHWKKTAVYAKLSYYILWILDNIDFR